MCDSSVLSRRESTAARHSGTWDRTRLTTSARLDRGLGRRPPATEGQTMGMLSGLQQLLDAHHVPYEVHPHPQAFTAVETAAMDGVPPSEMVKVVVLRSHDRFLMAALPASRRLDLDRLRETV